MKTLIVFYSRTGRTRTVAQDLSAQLGADLEELKETADRTGAAGYLRAGRDAMLKRPAELLPTTRRPGEYDLVVLATPVWSFTMCPAIRSWLQREAASLRAVAFVCTQGGSGAERTLRDMRELAGHDPLTTLVLRDRDIRAGACGAAVAAFAAGCRTPAACRA
jgi:menaquinone-dependent protoporphyrinogen IX oxidase